jgi:hypothetical protein
MPDELASDSSDEGDEEEDTSIAPMNANVSCVISDPLVWDSEDPSADDFSCNTEDRDLIKQSASDSGFDGINFPDDTSSPPELQEMICCNVAQSGFDVAMHFFSVMQTPPKTHMPVKDNPRSVCSSPVTAAEFPSDPIQPGVTVAPHPSSKLKGALCLTECNEQLNQILCPKSEICPSKI